MTDDRRIRILHLDDEPTVLSATENYIERFADGISVETTTDPESALDRLETGQFDCLLSDYEMPRMDGLAVLDAVNERGLDVPVVMYTGRGSEDVASEAFSKGVADYIPKGDGMDHYASLVADISAAVGADDGDAEVTATGGDDPAAATTADDGPTAVTVRDEGAAPAVDDTADPDRRVHALADWTRRVATADSMSALHREALAAVEAVLGLSVAGIWRYDEAEGELVPETVSATTESAVEWTPVAAGSDTLLWDCYESGRSRSTTSPADSGMGETTTLESVLVAPLGEYGVLVGASTDGTTIGETEDSLFNTLASSVTAAAAALDRRADARETEAFTRGLLDSLPDMFYAFDEHGQYYRWNDELLEASGYDESEIETLRPWDLIPDHDADRVRAVIREIVETGTSDRVESWLETRDGREIPYEYTGAPIRNADGEVVGVTGIGRDISEQRARQERLEETKQRLDLALESTDTGVWEWNVETDTVFRNESTHRLFGVDPGEFEETFDAFVRKVHPEDRPDVEAALERALEDGEEYSPEFRVQQPDGDVRWMAARSELVTDDDGTRRMVGTITDITERKEKERKLREHERKLRQISENIDEIVWMNTPSQDGIQFVSDAYEDIWGRPTATLEESYEAFIEAIHPEDRDRVVDALAAQQQHPDSYDEIYRVVQPDGEVRWVRDRSSGVYDEDGDLERIVGIATDITDRKEREQELEETRQQLDLALESTDTGVWSYDIESGTIIPYGETTALFGTDSDEADVERYFDNVHPEDTEMMRSEIEDAIQTHGQYDAAFRVLVDGTERWLKSRGQVLGDDGDTGQQMLGVTTDITGQKQREQELEETRQQLDLALEETDTGVWLLDTAAGTMTAYGKTAELHGVVPNVTEAAAYTEHIHPDDMAELTAVFGRERDTGRQLDAEFRVQVDGEVRWLRSKGKVIAEKETGDRILGVTTDITGRKRKEQQLQRNRDFLEQTQRLADVGGWEADLDGDEATWSDPIRDIVDAPPDYDPETLGEAMSYFHPDDIEAAWSALEAMSEGQRKGVELRVQTEHGETRWVSAVGEPVFEDGEVVRIRGAMQDITDRKERERELAESEARFRGIFENAHDALVIANDDGEYVDANPAACDMFGVDYDDLLGKTAADFAPRDFDFEEAWQEFLGSDTQRGEFPLLRPDGDQRIVEFSAVTNIRSGQHLSALRDITERKEREREIERQNERLELLASTISHDLRNPLRSAQTNLKMARHECESDLLDDIAFAHERMEELIADLLTLARQGQAVTSTDSTDLAATAREVWDGVETADATLSADPVTVQTDRTRLRQLFENLFVNAVEHGSTGVHVRIGPTERGFYVEDDGPGVPADERDHVFEYGYSTAETGTGFGLAIVSEIADAHGWRVTLTESDDGGARFEFET